MDQPESRESTGDDEGRHQGIEDQRFHAEQTVPDINGYLCDVDHEEKPRARRDKLLLCEAACQQVHIHNRTCRVGHDGRESCGDPIEPGPSRQLAQVPTPLEHEQDQHRRHNGRDHTTQKLFIKTQCERAARSAEHNPGDQRQQFARLGMSPPVEDCENIAGAENGSRPRRCISGAADNQHHHGDRQSPAARQAALGGPKRERAESSEQPLPKCEVRHCECRVSDVGMPAAPQFRFRLHLETKRRRFKSPGVRSIGIQRARRRSVAIEGSVRGRQSFGDVDRILKLDESCISNPTSEIANWTTTQ